MLGTTGALGRVLGLPIDSLHVTFVSANCAYAMVTLEGQLSWDQIADICAGVGVVGLRNLDQHETLSIELTCTNQNLPRQLGLGDICLPARKSCVWGKSV